MNKEEAYSVWAPDACVWCKWVKPVLFAYLTESTPALGDAEPEGLGKSIPAASPETGLVIDLDGPRGVFFGMRLARKGYRPVPLYNACPQPHLPASPQRPAHEGSRVLEEGLHPQRYEPVVDVAPLVSALGSSTEELRRLDLPGYAPPAFLLDARRRGEGKKASVGMFDNRSVIFPSDFPSAEFLKSRGITRMVVFLEAGAPQFDLAAVLREWQAAGIDIRSQIAGLTWDPSPLALPKPSWLQKAWFWLRAHLDVRKNPSGGYGAIRRASG